MVKLLVDKGADLKVVENRNGMNALVAASVRGHTDTVRVLLEKGLGVNSKDKDGGISLMWATYGGYDDTMKLLLDKGADINAKHSIEV